jgi:hypothetical protein
MPDRTTRLAEAHAAFVDERGWAQGVSRRRLQRRVRRWERRRDRLDDVALARLKACQYELTDRPT